MTRPNYLGIEIGGTKLQLGVGNPDSPQLVEVVRDTVDVASGAAGILEKIRIYAESLSARHDVRGGVGIGFGGPVDRRAGVTTKSHQIDGWEHIPLCRMIEDWLSLPTSVDNDCNVAALAEARLGAGQGAHRVFYLTVGTGIGGGFVVGNVLDGSERPAISEIGHLRPGPLATSPHETVESMASGWGISTWVRNAVKSGRTTKSASQLLRVCADDLEALTTKQIGEVAKTGNELAVAAVERCTETLGWAIAQMVTLLAPEVIVIGGGVSLMGDFLFETLREQAAAYVFPPLRQTYTIVPAQLGEEVVVHGAIQIAAAAGDQEQKEGWEG